MNGVVKLWMVITDEYIIQLVFAKWGHLIVNGSIDKYGHWIVNGSNWFLGPIQ